ncbi:hypothetical protein BU16DRAFT_566627 [Lophium mytilinum]|uniref:Uncharacterized protein n=1 Tax=Lophium mytilinum TaxID=390894 RepID=A0A6A6QDX5_9PEZI|nr:hypothetical protein BU16DRAFT_566627 [Lophium mytilinum]
METHFHRPGELQSTEAPSPTPTINPGQRFLHDAQYRTVVLVAAAAIAVLLVTIGIVVWVCVCRRRKRKARAVADVERGYKNRTGFNSIPLHWLKGPGGKPASNQIGPHHGSKPGGR